MPAPHDVLGGCSLCPGPAAPQSVQWGDLAKEILLSPWLLACLEAEMAVPLEGCLSALGWWVLRKGLA